MTRTTRQFDLARGKAVPAYPATSDELATLSLLGGQGGVLLGTTLTGTPFTVSVVRETPTRICLVGGLYLARQIALRAMATGAWVVVTTGRPAAWQPLVRASGLGHGGSRAPAVQIRKLGPFHQPGAAEDAPRLLIVDAGSAPADQAQTRPDWQTTMTVLPFLHPQAAQTTNSADLILLQRLQPGQAQLAARIWQLPTQMEVQLASLPEDQVVALGRNIWRPFRLVTGPTERGILGPVRRGD